MHLYVYVTFLSKTIFSSSSEESFQNQTDSSQINVKPNGKE